jgi:hypothetical protein
LFSRSRQRKLERKISKKGNKKEEIENVKRQLRARLIKKTHKNPITDQKDETIEKSNLKKSRPKTVIKKVRFNEPVDTQTFPT